MMLHGFAETVWQVRADERRQRPESDNGFNLRAC